MQPDPHAQIPADSRRIYTVLIADDHLLVRIGIKSLLQHMGNFHVVAEAENGRTALACQQQFKPDIILVDIAMPELSGIEAAQQMRQVDPEVKILILSAYDTEDIVRQALAAGVQGYLLKDFALNELSDALHQVLQGETYISPRLAPLLSQDVTTLRLAGKPRLTARQLEILRLVATGASTKEIAKQLQVSPKTIEYHRAQVMQRLGLHDIASLTLYASRHGLLPT
ncbi:response regulator [Leeia oryzae]|uniref:response regulator n=1 Tax=Leeia oryzae TaxID=356662 RepID=UPI00037513A0|nr:response regulator transcription factor [Leeia oryzae]